MDDVFDDLKNAGYTRLVDGGYVDNNSAATMLRHIQKKMGREVNLTWLYFTICSNNIEGEVSNSDDIEGLEIKVGTKNELLAFNQQKDQVIGSPKNNYSKMILPWGVAAMFGNDARRTGHMQRMMVM